MIEVTGLPADANVLVIVPVRRPLPPGAAVQLFTQQDAGWVERLPGGYGSIDGQYVVFALGGSGTLAAGTPSGLQSGPAGATATAGGTAGRPRPAPTARLDAGQLQALVERLVQQVLGVSGSGQAAIRQALVARAGGATARSTTQPGTSGAGSGTGGLGASSGGGSSAAAGAQPQIDRITGAINGTCTAVGDAAFHNSIGQGANRDEAIDLANLAESKSPVPRE